MGSSSEKLELHEPEEAFRRIEEWLRAQGFFEPGGESLAADLYLGYGLSHVLRRERTPAPPEPCRLPLAACEVRRETTPVAQSHNELELGAWERTWAAAEYAAAVERVREAIARGDVYQVNLVQHLSAPIDGHPRALTGAVAARLGHLDPLHREPFVGESWAVVSASPELFLERSGRRTPISSANCPAFGSTCNRIRCFLATAKASLSTMVLPNCGLTTLMRCEH